MNLCVTNNDYKTHIANEDSVDYARRCLIQIIDDLNCEYFEASGVTKLPKYCKKTPEQRKQCAQ